MVRTQAARGIMLIAMRKNVVVLEVLMATFGSSEARHGLRSGVPMVSKHLPRRPLALECLAGASLSEITAAHFSLYEGQILEQQTERC